MLLEEWTEKDWYHPKWYDQALSAVYEGIWLESTKYDEAESKLLQLGYFPKEVPQAVIYGDKKPPRKYVTVLPKPVIKTPKRVDKKLSKERQHMKDIQSSLASEIAFARQKIQTFLKSSDIYACDFDTPGWVPSLIPAREGVEKTSSFRQRVEKLEKEYDIIIKRLNALTEEVRLKIHTMNEEAARPKVKDPRAESSEFNKVSDEINANLKAQFLENWPEVPKITMAAAAMIDDFDDYDELALFEGTDEMTAEGRKEEIEAESDKKDKKPAKTQYVLDLLTAKSRSNREMMELTKSIRGLKKDGLRIRATKILSVQYQVRRLQVVCIAEDAKYTLPELRNIFKERNYLIERVEVVHIKKL